MLVSYKRNRTIYGKPSPYRKIHKEHKDYICVMNYQHKGECMAWGSRASLKREGVVLGG